MESHHTMFAAHCDHEPGRARPPGAPSLIRERTPTARPAVAPYHNDGKARVRFVERLTLRSLLESVALPREALEKFLDPNFVSWAKHDPELGYRLSNVVVKDGVDGARSIYTYEPNGARRVGHYRERPCRINTFGDSMTQCHQVSDGETWQEVLAAHFGEPIRNFGVGGYGIYQAYRRMMRI